MPWRQVEVMKERFQFVRDDRRRLVSFTELCAMYGISRPVGYKWLHRAERSGMDYLEEPAHRCCFWALSFACSDLSNRPSNEV